MPFLPPNQQCQSTEGKAKSKTTICQSALGIFCSLLHRLEQVVAVQIWVAQRVAQLGNSPWQTCNKSPQHGCATEVIMCHRGNSKGKGKGFPYSTPSVGPGADPGVQAVSLQVTVSNPPGSRLPSLSARPAIISPATEHHRPLAGTKLYCLVTEAHRCKQLA